MIKSCWWWIGKNIHCVFFFSYCVNKRGFPFQFAMFSFCEWQAGIGFGFFVWHNVWARGEDFGFFDIEDILINVCLYWYINSKLLFDMCVICFWFAFFCYMQMWYVTLRMTMIIKIWYKEKEYFVLFWYKVDVCWRLELEFNVKG